MSSWLSSSACPTPATLPWPKMPKQPAISRCSTPSRSVYWAARNRTSAWATVSFTGSPPSAVLADAWRSCVPPRGRQGQPRVELLLVPRRADPGVCRVVGEAPCALAGPRHDVEVIEVVAGGGHRRAVVAVRHHDGVAGAHLGGDVDLAARAGRGDAVVAEPAPRDLVVVDLLEHRLLAGPVLVVLVRWIRGPVAGRGE